MWRRLAKGLNVKDVHLYVKVPHSTFKFKSNLSHLHHMLLVGSTCRLRHQHGYVSDSIPTKSSYIKNGWTPATVRHFKKKTPPHANVKWEVLMGSDWWSWHINSSWAMFVKQFNILSHWHFILMLKSAQAWSPSEAEKRRGATFTASVKYLEWRIHILPAKLPTCHLLTGPLIYSWRQWRSKWIWQLGTSGIGLV